MASFLGPQEHHATVTRASEGMSVMHEQLSSPSQVPLNAQDVNAENIIIAATPEFQKMSTNEVARSCQDQVLQDQERQRDLPTGLSHGMSRVAQQSSHPSLNTTPTSDVMTGALHPTTDRQDQMLRELRERLDQSLRRESDLEMMLASEEQGISRRWSASGCVGTASESC